MKKSMYSLMLAEHLVERLDALAHTQGLSRSALLNNMLADYFELSTPEQEQQMLYQAVVNHLTHYENLRVLSAGGNILTITGQIAYRYNPNIHYYLEIRSGQRIEGELRVASRTQNKALLHALSNFFALWQEIDVNKEHSSYDDGKFKVQIRQEKQTIEPLKQVGNLLGRYIGVLDQSLNLFLSQHIPESSELITQNYQKELDKLLFQP